LVHTTEAGGINKFPSSTRWSNETTPISWTHWCGGTEHPPASGASALAILTTSNHRLFGNRHAGNPERWRNGNVTGLYVPRTDVDSKLFQFLGKTLPSFQPLAVLVNVNSWRVVSKKPFLADD